MRALQRVGLRQGGDLVPLAGVTLEVDSLVGLGEFTAGQGGAGGDELGGGAAEAAAVEKFLRVGDGREQRGAEGEGGQGGEHAAHVSTFLEE